VKAFVVVALDQRGTQKTVQLENENHAVAYLRQTHSTEAIIAFTYSDGTPVPRNLINRIHDHVFEALSLIKQMSDSPDADAGQRLCLDARKVLLESH